MDAERKAAALVAIKRHVREQGFPPTMREIGDAIGVRSTSYIQGLLYELHDDGAIAYEGTRTRAIKVLGPECPACGQCRPTSQV